MFYKIIFGLFVITLLSLSAVADDLKKSRQLITETNETLQTSQKKIDEIDAQYKQMFQQYKTLKKEINNYQVYNRQLTDIIDSQNQEIENLRKDIAQIESTSIQIMPFMEKMIGGLESFVASDFPFLPEERSTRLQQLKDNMKRADLSNAAKYRQILEAYQIEIDYGKTIESYEGHVDNRKVHFLRIGRIGLYYLSLDKSYCAAWHPTKQQWQTLEDTDYKLSIAKAIKIAKKQRAPDFFFAAVGPAGGRK